MMLQNSEWRKDGFKVLNRPMGFNVTEYTKFIDMVLDFPLTFKKPLLTEFWYIIKGKYLQLFSLGNSSSISNYKSV